MRIERRRFGLFFPGARELYYLAPALDLLGLVKDDCG
jgi:hypothetical protein